MAHSRIEEVVDDDEIADDPEEMDLDAFDFARPQHGSLQSSSSQPSVGGGGGGMTPDMIQAMMQQAQGSAGPPGNMQRHGQMSEQQRREAREATKKFQCIYPIYFDSTRSREDGRRVRKEDAVPNPLAWEIVNALQRIGNAKGVQGWQIAFEPDKTHPKDWGNPGRVRVSIKRDGSAVSSKVGNKHYLYKLIAADLKAHPTTEESIMGYRYAGMPPMKEKPPPPAVPRGFKIGSIVPLHSPALSGGGVSDNFLKDMMAEMGGQAPPGMEGLMGAMGGAGGGGGTGQPKKVKDKKKK